jgi:hypothetical protein
MIPHDALCLPGLPPSPLGSLSISGIEGVSHDNSNVDSYWLIVLWVSFCLFLISGDFLYNKNIYFASVKTASVY